MFASTSLGADSPLRGLQAVEEPLPWFDAQPRYSDYDDKLQKVVQNAVPAVTSLTRKPLEAPMELLLSRSVYPAEDGHLDVLLRLRHEGEGTPKGSLRLILLDGEGRELDVAECPEIPGDQLYFSFAYPPTLAGKDGSFKVIRTLPDGTSSNMSATFRVKPAAQVPTEGKIALTLPNPHKVSMKGVPVTVGVPFPHGALASDDHLRLVDEAGKPVPLQVRETSRWSRFGPVRWALCDFVTDLEGKPRSLTLEYGPDLRRPPRAEITIGKKGSFPNLDTGWLRIDEEGIRFQDSPVLLKKEALLGAFVERVDGLQFRGWGHRHVVADQAPYQMDPDAPFEIEQAGPEKVVLKTEGDYRQGERRFCRYLVRYVFHRDSPLIRIFHTWIYTGDGNREPIRTMGWRFPLAEAQPAGFLSEFGKDAAWHTDYYLRQERHDQYTRFAYAPPEQRDRRIMEHEGATPALPLRETATGRRAPGVMRAAGKDVSVHFGVKGFWQNFPSSLLQEPGVMTFHQWPKYGAPRTHTFQEKDDIWRLWFAHEGENLSFRLPMELTEGPIYRAESGVEPHFAYGRPDSVNAQGVAKTAEMWLLFSRDNHPVDQLEALSSEGLRAVVDPKWMMASGVFHEMSARDDEALPQDEKIYELNLLKPVQQVERMGLYGKWIYGDLLRNANLDEQTASLYRTFRKAHWGWPYFWTAFARSGDLRFYTFAEAATRMMSDIAFCHYVNEDVADQFAALPPRLMWERGQPFRAIGWHNRNLIPWAGYWGPSSRLYVDKEDYLWQAYYLTGYDRARDVALAWAAQTKVEQPDRIARGPITGANNRSRWPVNLQKQYLEMYQATFDPWFLAGTHALGQMNVHRFKTFNWGGHPWNTGPHDFQRYTGDPEHELFMRAFAYRMNHWQTLGWASEISTLFPTIATGWHLTGDPLFARRAAGSLQAIRQRTFSGTDPSWYSGYNVFSQGEQDMLSTSFYQQWFPYLPPLIKAAEGLPPIPPAFSQTIPAGTRLFVRKTAGKPLELHLPLSHRISAPDGTSLESDVSGTASPSRNAWKNVNTWRPSQEIDAAGKEWTLLPAEAPEGVYTVEFTQAGKLLLPVSPPDTPEVLHFGEGKAVAPASGAVQYAFHVPEGTKAFTLAFDHRPMERQFVRQIIVWTPDQREAWAHRSSAASDTPGTPLSATVEVPPGMDGKVWTVSLPAFTSLAFRPEAPLSPYIATSPDRWFKP